MVHAWTPWQWAQSEGTPRWRWGFHIPQFIIFELVFVMGAALLWQGSMCLAMCCYHCSYGAQVLMLLWVGSSVVCIQCGNDLAGGAYSPRYPFLFSSSWSLGRTLALVLLKVAKVAVILLGFLWWVVRELVELGQWTTHLKYL